MPKKKMKKHAKIHWKPEEDATLVEDFTLYTRGRLSLRELRKKYRGRSIQAMRTRMQRIKGIKPKTPLLGKVKKRTPNFLKGVEARLLAANIGPIEVQKILFGSEVKLKPNTIRALESLVGQNGTITLRLYAHNDRVSFEEIK